MRSFRALSRDARGVALLEFGLSLPLFLGFVCAGIEMSNYIFANNRTQRLAAMTADLVAQSGVGRIGVAEGQLYDLFSAIELTSKPYDVRKDGRVVITAVKGTDLDNNGVVENRILWQRFDGNYTQATPILGCAQTTPFASLPAGRVLPLDEVLFHVQVSYRYPPMFSSVPFRWLELPIHFSRTAMFRARNTEFQTPTPDPRFPAKSRCSSPTGL